MNARRLFIAARAFVIAVLLIGSLWAQNYLCGRADFASGNYPLGVTAADFNGDGKLDIAVSNFDDNTVSVLLGIRNGTFGAAVTYATGASPETVVAADFNGDKKLDLAVANESDHTVSILLGNGDGTFQTQHAYAVGYFPVGIVAADFNGDKKPDIGVVNNYDSTVSILINNGDGTFQSQMLVTVGSTPTGIGSGDFNGDGRTDLITTNIGTGTVSVLLSNGDGTFTRTDSTSGLVPGSNTSEVTVGDFNGDGVQDAVVSSATTYQLFVLAGRGDGSFNSPAAIPNAPQFTINVLTTKEINGDGHPDLVAGVSVPLAGVAVLLGKGDGTFAGPLLSLAGSGAPGLVVSDLNGDDAVDLVALNAGYNSVQVLMGNRNGTFGAVTSVKLAPKLSSPAGASAADFNGDGKLDLAVAGDINSGGEISVQLGNGDGTFQKPIVSPLDMFPISNSQIMFSADFNGDGKSDVILMDSYNVGFDVALGNGNGTFQFPVNTMLGYTVVDIAVGDLNGDGKADLAVSSNGSAGNPAVNIFLSNGDGTFRSGVQFAVPFYSGVALADVNLDGKTDLLVASSDAPLEVFLGNGDGTFQGEIAGPVAGYTSGLAAADFDGDGKIDLAAGTSTGIAFLGGNGDGSFRTPVYSNGTIQFVGPLLVGDFSGDGKPDLLGYGPIVMVNLGNGVFGQPIIYGATGFDAGLAIGDFNADGVTDFGLANQSFDTGISTVLVYASGPIINVYPSSLSFGALAVGKTSKPKPITLTNTGNGPLNLSTITASGDFQESNKCGAVLAIGKSCTIQVVFKPTTKGPRTGAVSFSDNAAASPQKVHLSGTGQ